MVFTKAVPGVDGELCLNNLTEMLNGGSLDIDEDGDFDKSDVRLVITFYTYYTIYKGDVSKISASVFPKAVPGVDGEACLNKLISLLP